MIPASDPVAAESGIANAVSWEMIDSMALDTELHEGQHGRRVVKVFSGDPKAPDLWYGIYGNAPVEAGHAGFILSDGSTVTL